MTIATVRGVLKDSAFHTAHPGESLEQACDRMAEHGVNALVVLKHDVLHGILTEHDVLRHVSQKGGYATAVVAEAMTPDVTFVQTRDSLIEVHGIMRRERVRQVPVMDLGGKIVGLLRREDLAFVDLQQSPVAA